jgi:hypothetical protein
MNQNDIKKNLENKIEYGVMSIREILGEVDKSGMTEGASNKLSYMRGRIDGFQEVLRLMNFRE